MSMTTLGLVGAGAGAVIAGGMALIGGYNVLEAGAGVVKFMKAEEKDWKLISLQIILTLACAVFACSCGYTSFLLAEAVWLNSGVPSLLVPLSVAAGSLAVALIAARLGKKHAVRVSMQQIMSGLGAN